MADAGAVVQVAGGIRSAADAGRWLGSGATAVVMGTAAVRDPALLAGVATGHPDRVLAAVDVRQGRPADRPAAPTGVSRRLAVSGRCRTTAARLLRALAASTSRSPDGGRAASGGSPSSQPYVSRTIAFIELRRR